MTREELPETRRFWERQGFREIRRDPPNVELRRPLRTFLFNVPDPDAMRELGRSLAGQLRAGDLLVLSGELGAGKTTFTQGVGDGLGVRGDVTSPTFVIARVHPSLGAGPPLVHVDAYRLGGIDELDDLDLDTSLEDAVTVVEWGEGIAEGLAESRLEIRIIRALAHQDEHADLDPRRVLMTPIGPRWYEMEVPSTHRPPLAEKLNENLLLDFRRCPEEELDDLDPYIPLQLSVIVAEHDGRVLLVHNMRRLEWELPVADIEDVESARAAAVRAFREETGSEPGEVEFFGVATVQLGHERSIEYAAIYRTALTELSEFDAHEDVDKLAWWDVVRDYEVCRRSTNTWPGWCSRRISPPDWAQRRPSLSRPRLASGPAPRAPPRGRWLAVSPMASAVVAVRCGATPRFTRPRCGSRSAARFRACRWPRRCGGVRGGVVRVSLGCRGRR